MTMEDDAALWTKAMDRSAPMSEEPEAVEQPGPEIETQEAPQVEAEHPQQARDASGRFAKSEETQQDAQSGEGQAERQGFVPSSRHREEADARRNAEARLAQLEAQNRALMEMVGKFQPQKPPASAEPEIDPVDAMLSDPRGFVQRMMKPIEEERQREREFYSRRNAETVHGREKVDAAYQALGAEIRAGRMDGATVLAQLRQSMDPYGEIMNWHSRNSIVSQMGDNPEAYIEAEVQKRLAAMKEQGGGAAPPPVVKIPASLSRATSVASNAVDGSAQMSDADLWKRAMRR